jgi:hypothetical protein
MNREKITVATTIMGVLFIIAATVVFVQTTTPTKTFGLLSKEPPSIMINGPPINITADKQDIDIQVDPSDPLPLNGTVSIPTTGATDSDMNGFSPLGVSVIIQNDTVTVTNHPISIDNLAAEIKQQADESNDDG